MIYDAFENADISCDTKQAEKRNECDHCGVDSGGTDYYGTSNPPQEADWNFTYCPKCGELLQLPDGKKL